MSAMYERVNNILTSSNALVFVCAVIIISAGIFYVAPINTAPNEYKVELEGKIVEYPDVRADKTILVLQVILEPQNNPIETRVRISADNLEKYSYGEYVFVKGILKEPENFSNFNWVGYLTKENIQYVMNRPNIQKTGKIDKNLFYYMASLRQKLQDGINTSLLPPDSSLYSAMTLANKGGLSQEQRDSLAAVGLSHIVAISGMHIAVITYIIFGFLLWIGMWKRQASILGAILITGYILMIGAPASAVRAGIMVGVLILAQLFGRPNFSWRALVYAAGIMVLFNPYVVRYDVGFQLSFLAVLGIIIFYKKIEYFLRKAQYRFVEIISRAAITKDRSVSLTYAAEGKFGFTSIFAITIAAQSLTFPLIIYNFGNFSLVSPITNILVVSMLPIVLVSGFLASISGIVGGTVAYIFSAPAWLFSSYVWSVVEFFS